MRDVGKRHFTHSVVVMVVAIAIMVSACNVNAPGGTEPSNRAQLQTPDSAKVIVVDDQIPPDLTNPDAVAAFQNGYIHMLARQWHSAIAAYDEAVRQQPDSAATHNARGTTHLYAGNHADAIGDYTTAIELEPDNAAHWRRRAHAHNTGPTPQPEKAVSDATKAIELDPSHHMGYGQRSVALTMLPTLDWYDALAYLDRSIERHPKHDSGAYEFRAWINEQLGDHAQAQRDRQMAR